MRKIWQAICVTVLGLILGAAMVGCGSSTTAKDKMKADKMEADHMATDKMKADKMETNKMAADKMTGSKMAADKMEKN